MPRALVQALQQNAVDVTSAQAQGMRRAADAAQLEFATSLGRILMTANVGDYSRLHVEFLTSGRHHAGIIAIHQQWYGGGEQLRRLLRLMHSRSEAEMVDALEFLSNWG